MMPGARKLPKEIPVSGGSMAYRDCDCQHCIKHYMLLFGRRGKDNQPKKEITP